MGKNSYGFPGLKNVSHNLANTHNIDSNTKSISKRYSLKENGYFGAPSSHKKSNSSNREIYTKDPVESARRLFRILGRGGIQIPLRNDDGSVYGWKRVMKNATITYRPKQSSDKSPVVEIHRVTKSIKQQKIHFYKKGNKK